MDNTEKNGYRHKAGQLKLSLLWQSILLPGLQSTYCLKTAC